MAGVREGAGKPSKKTPLLLSAAKLAWNFLSRINEHSTYAACSEKEVTAAGSLLFHKREPWEPFPIRTGTDRPCGGPNVEKRRPIGRGGRGHRWTGPSAQTRKASCRRAAMAGHKEATAAQERASYHEKGSRLQDGSRNGLVGTI